MKASVLIVDDDAALRRVLADRFRFWQHTVAVAADGEEALRAAGERVFDLVLLDIQLPGASGLEILQRLRAAECGADIVMLTAHGSVERAVEAMKLGATDFLTKPADFGVLEALVTRTLERRRVERANIAYRDRTERDSNLIVGESPVMRELVDTAERAAASDAAVLLLGESGTGKQLLAELIHRRSPRAAGPFVYVNCVAISDELIESTLFGHEKGAFTGAVARKPGRFEMAGGGTAFLDEIGDISPALQAKLLHFLEAGEFERVGGTQTLSVDCRVVAATNRDLAKAVEEGRFRQDLYYRLNVITLRIPPLRERAEDIPVLASAFLERSAAELRREGLVFAEETLEVMRRYAWPGNVRQLRNAVERMAVLGTSPRLAPELLPPEVAGGGGAAAGDLLGLPYREAMDGFRDRLLQRALERAGGNQTRAAEMLGIQRSYLNRLLKEKRGEEGEAPGSG